ncbi:hypothetical protein [Azonexus sp.]|jgi:hypothetical protein|uniref:hypothetical protein n=1 Tax=Azonexus sp. TaxID=1872668 RepID=UPI00283A2B74|nr:hypothetical protein [Azonexus sp.]MDR1995322.1 hypothetical protein [Azonexus sp.]
MSKYISLLLAVTALITASGCKAKEPATVSLTGIVYNYSQEGYVSIKINGKSAGATVRKTEMGGVSGGSGVCCFDLPVGAKQVEIELEPSLSEGYKTTATIEKWWPDLAHYGVVHILPGRKVVMEVRSVHTWPRKDLMESRFKELGIKPSKIYTLA